MDAHRLRAPSDDGALLADPPLDAAGAGLNLIVDNALAKSPAVRVPHPQDGAIRTRRVDYDDWGREVPYEDLPVANESRFATFADRVLQALDGAVADPVIDDFWPRVL